MKHTNLLLFSVDYFLCKFWQLFSLVFAAFIIPVRCNRQAALLSALFNYTPLVIGGTDKNKQLTIIKPAQTGINRNK